MLSALSGSIASITVHLDTRDEVVKLSERVLMQVSDQKVIVGEMGQTLMIQRRRWDDVQSRSSFEACFDL